MAEYKKNKIVDTEIQTNGFERRSEEFQEGVTESGEIYNLIRELTEEASHKAFKKVGVEQVEGYAGVYSTGEKYGSGVEEGKYDVRLSSNVKPIIEKQTTYGTKQIETEITSDFDPVNELLKVNYDGTEKAVFRGHMGNEDPMGFMINDKITVSTKDKSKMKKELKKFFDNAARKEAGYLMTTKIGIDDRLETSMAGSIVEGININKTNVNDLLNSSVEEIANFFGETIRESIQRDLEDETVDGPEDFNNQDVIDANTQGNLLFDVEIGEEEAIQYKELVKSIANELFPYKDFEDLDRQEMNKVYVDAEKVWNSPEKTDMLSEVSSGGMAIGRPGTVGPYKYATYVEVNNNRIEAFKDLDTIVPFEERAAYLETASKNKVNNGGALNESEEDLEEMTTAGAPGAPGSAGAFQYQSPYAFKKTTDIEETNYAKKKKKRPSIKKAKNEGDSFWTTIDAEGMEDLQKTHTLGLPGVEPGSKEEDEINSGGGAASTKFIHKLEEGRVHNLDKRKFVSDTDNVQTGLNKRYIVSNKLSESELKNKWSKLSNFISESTIEKEELSSDDIKMLNECGCPSKDIKDFVLFNGNIVSREEADKQMNAEFEEENEESNFASKLEDLIDVEKPDSLGVVLTVSKEDFMNENLKYIYDHNTKNFVLHPGIDQANIVTENKATIFNIATRSFVPNPKYKK